VEVSDVEIVDRFPIASISDPLQVNEAAIFTQEFIADLQVMTGLPPPSFVIERVLPRGAVKDQPRAWEEFYQSLSKYASKTGYSIVRPRRRKNGRWMTVALFDGSYRQTKENGLLDMERTIECLKSAEVFLDGAVSNLNAESTD
jgi:hypothetical protein